MCNINEKFRKPYLKTVITDGDKTVVFARPLSDCFIRNI